VSKKKLKFYLSKMLNILHINQYTLYVLIYYMEQYPDSICPYCKLSFYKPGNVVRHILNPDIPCGKLKKQDSRKNIKDINITNDFFNIYPYDDTPLGDITPAELMEVMNHSSKCIYTGLIQLLHFNKEKPNNHNIYCPQKPKSEVWVYSDRWMIDSATPIFCTVIKKIRPHLLTIQNEYRGLLDSEGNKKIEQAIIDGDRPKFATDTAPYIGQMALSSTEIVKPTFIRTRRQIGFHPEREKKNKNWFKNGLSLQAVEIAVNELRKRQRDENNNGDDQKINDIFAKSTKSKKSIQNNDDDLEVNVETKNDVFAKPTKSEKSIQNNDDDLEIDVETKNSVFAKPTKSEKSIQNNDDDLEIDVETKNGVFAKLTKSEKSIQNNDDDSEFRKQLRKATKLHLANGRKEITSKEELDNYQLGSLISYVYKSGAHKIGGFLEKIKDEYFIYRDPYKNENFKVRFAKIDKMWIESPYNTTNDIISMCNTDQPKTKLPVIIGDVIVYYASSHEDRRRFNNTIEAGLMYRWHDLYGITKIHPKPD
jgi:hypothetical protein